MPTGTTFVSAANGGLLSSGVITWSGLTVPGGGTSSVSFVVTANSTNVQSQTIPNTAHFTDVNTPNCNGAATCDTNTVVFHEVYTAPATTTTSTTATTTTIPSTTTSSTSTTSVFDPGTTTTTTAKQGSLVFTGANALTSIAIAGGALGLGGLLVLGSRRRRQG